MNILELLYDFPGLRVNNGMSCDLTPGRPDHIFIRRFLEGGISIPTGGDSPQSEPDLSTGIRGIRCNSVTDSVSLDGREGMELRLMALLRPF